MKPKRIEYCFSLSKKAHDIIRAEAQKLGLPMSRYLELVLLKIGRKEISL